MVTQITGKTLRGIAVQTVRVALGACPAGLVVTQGTPGTVAAVCAGLAVCDAGAGRTTPSSIRIVSNCTTEAVGAVLAGGTRAIADSAGEVGQQVVGRLATEAVGRLVAGETVCWATVTSPTSRVASVVVPH